MVEVLVVIVVFLVGILAIAQIFPRGFRILELNRRSSVASALARDSVERIKSNPEQLPEAILSVTYAGGNALPDPTRDSYDLGPVGDSIDGSGVLSRLGVPLGNWQRFTGANAMRRIVGETRQIPAPSLVGKSAPYYGSLVVLNNGPIDPDNGAVNAAAALRVYGPDLSRKLGQPNPLDLQDDSAYSVANPDVNSVSLWLPAGPQARTYLVSFSAYTTVGGISARRDYSYLQPVIVPVTAVNPATGSFPPFQVALATLLPVTDTLQSVVVSTVRVQRSFARVANTALFGAGDPYQFKLLNEYLGVILLSPSASGVSVVRSNGVREPLQVRFNYDVYDWRNLREDFRPTASSPFVHQLAVRGLKVGTENGPDGRPNGMLPSELAAPNGYLDMSATNDAEADNFVLMDMATGGVVYEKSALAPTTKLVVVDKSLGNVTLTTSNSSLAGLRAQILLPDGNRIEDVAMEGRSLRAIYRTKAEYAVQLLKAASQFSNTQDGANVFYDQYYIGGTGVVGGALTRVYFSKSNNGRKVNLGNVNFQSSASAGTRTMVGQDFLIGYPRDNDPTGLPCLDLRDVDPTATGFIYNSGSAVRDVRAASVAVRVIWNPTNLTLTNNGTTNLQKVEQWGREWRRNTNETFIQRSEIVR